MGHLQTRSVSSIRLIFLACRSTSDTFASASGLISLAEGCGGKGWPAGAMGLRRGMMLVRGAGTTAADSAAFVWGAGAGDGLGAALAAGASFVAAAGFDGADAPPPERLDKPSRCTLPITALRVTPPNSLAIWLADWPSPHIFFSISTRSSVQDMDAPSGLAFRRARRSNISMAIWGGQPAIERPIVRGRAGSGKVWRAKFRQGVEVGMRKLLFTLGIAVWVVAHPVAAQTTPQEAAEVLAVNASAPAAVAGRVTADTLEAAVAGVRVLDEDALAVLGDAWHMGSLTKSMTATLAARLVEEGAITWDTRLGAVLGDAYPEMHADWQSSTLRALLTHLSGMGPNLQASSSRRLGDGPRSEYVAEMLSDPPSVAPGEFLYSNAGYVVAGAMLEAVGGASWEELMETYVFAPLGIESAGFGPPQGDAIQGHTVGFFGGLSAGGQGPAADNIPAMGPAGRVHMSAEDMLIYLRAHLIRDEAFLSAAAWDVLHAPVGEQDYAMGWGVGEDGSLVHSGSNTMWYAVAFVDPAAGLAVFVAVNSGDFDEVIEPVDEALRSLLEAQ